MRLITPAGRRRPRLPMLAATAAAIACSACHAPRQPSSGAGGTVARLADCAALAGMNFAGSPTGPTEGRSGAVRLDSVRQVAASALSMRAAGPTPAARIDPATPQHCRLLGHIVAMDPQTPPIRFQINLPMAWNGRAVQYGGDGLNGTVVAGTALLPGQRLDSPAPLALGYATYGTDGGHAVTAGTSPAAFAANDEALIHHAHAAYKKVRDVAASVIAQAYGQKLQRLYFVGNAEGGREALAMAQRYPLDFDGVIARAPSLQWVGQQFAHLRNGMASAGEGRLRPVQIQQVHDAVLRACDASDGLADGVVADAFGCKQRFDVRQLQCAPDAASGDDRCLSEAQVKAVRTVQSPFRFPFHLAHGLTDHPGATVGGEATTSAISAPSATPATPPSDAAGGWATWWLGKTPASFPPRPDNGAGWIEAAAVYPYFFAGDAQADPRQPPRWDQIAERVRRVSAQMDATNPDLSAFEARGGKLILLEPMADHARSPYASIQYAESVYARLGRSRAQGMLKLYTAPGVDHAGTGAPAQVDLLPVLAAWVEEGKLPGSLELVEQGATPPFSVRRARPLCAWPQWPRFQGGDPNSAASFVCQ